MPLCVLILLVHITDVSAVGLRSGRREHDDLVGDQSAEAAVVAHRPPLECLTECQTLIPREVVVPQVTAQTLAG